MLVVAIKRQKMGVTIQFESHHHELAGIYSMEYDSEVLEYYDQPPTIKLNYESASGRQLGVRHTPDYFVIRRKQAGWIELENITRIRTTGNKNATPLPTNSTRPMAVSSRRSLCYAMGT